VSENKHGGVRAGQGRKGGFTHLTVTKQRMRASRLMYLLYRTAVGEHEMTPAQITAATVYLRKVVPDLKQVDHTGEISHRHVSELSDAELIAIATGRGAGIALEAGGEAIAPEIH
jgi:hypothetical protein